MNEKSATTPAVLHLPLGPSYFHFYPLDEAPPKEGPHVKYIRADIFDELIKKLQRFEQMLAVGNPKIDGVSAARFRKEVQDAIAKATEVAT